MVIYWTRYLCMINQKLDLLTPSRSDRWILLPIQRQGNFGWWSLDILGPDPTKQPAYVF